MGIQPTLIETGINTIEKRIGNCFSLCLAFYAIVLENKMNLPTFYIVKVENGDHSFLLIDSKYFVENDENFVF